MKAKIRPHNMSAEFLATLDREARAYFFERVDKFAEKVVEVLSKRWLAATMLAANDQHGFGAKRGKDLIDGIIEIIKGNSDDVYGKKEVDNPGEDKSYNAMVAELEDRGIELQITVTEGNVIATVKEKKKKP